MWDSRYIPAIECSGEHPDSQSCPYGGTATPESPPLPSPNHPNQGKRGSKTRDIFTFRKHSWLKHASGMPLPIRLSLWAAIQSAGISGLHCVRHSCTRHLVWNTALCINAFWGTNVDGLFWRLRNLCFINNSWVQLSQTIKCKSSSIFHEVTSSGRTSQNIFGFVFLYMFMMCMHVLMFVCYRSRRICLCVFQFSLGLITYFCFYFVQSSTMNQTIIQKRSGILLSVALWNHRIMFYDHLCLSYPHNKYDDIYCRWEKIVLFSLRHLVWEFEVNGKLKKFIHIDTLYIYCAQFIKKSTKSWLWAWAKVINLLVITTRIPEMFGTFFKFE